VAGLGVLLADVTGDGFRTSMTRLAIIDGIRTPFCKAGTDLKPLPAQELGRVVVTELIGAHRPRQSQDFAGDFRQRRAAA